MAADEVDMETWRAVVKRAKEMMPRVEGEKWAAETNAATGLQQLRVDVLEGSGIVWVPQVTWTALQTTFGGGPLIARQTVRTGTRLSGESVRIDVYPVPLWFRGADGDRWFAQALAVTAGAKDALSVPAGAFPFATFPPRAPAKQFVAVAASSTSAPRDIMERIMSTWGHRSTLDLRLLLEKDEDEEGEDDEDDDGDAGGGEGVGGVGGDAGVDRFKLPRDSYQTLEELRVRQTGASAVLQWRNYPKAWEPLPVLPRLAEEDGGPPAKKRLVEGGEDGASDLAWDPAWDEAARARALVFRPEVGGRTRGVVGSENLGNTCFMNAALQCVSHTHLLTSYLVAGQHARELNTDNPLGSGGEVTSAFAALMRRIWGDWSGAKATKRSSVSPQDFKVRIGRLQPRFRGYNQHDSQELLSFLLDGMHEDLNRVKKKPYVEEPSGDDAADQVRLAQTAWDVYTKRNTSVIADLFAGLLRNRLECVTDGCGNVSVKFDPFFSLTVPLPSSLRAVVEVRLGRSFQARPRPHARAAKPFESPDPSLPPHVGVTYVEVELDDDEVPSEVVVQRVCRPFGGQLAASRLILLSADGRRARKWHDGADSVRLSTYATTKFDAIEMPNDDATDGLYLEGARTSYVGSKYYADMFVGDALVAAERRTRERRRVDRWTEWARNEAALLAAAEADDATEAAKPAAEAAASVAVTTREQVKAGAEGEFVAAPTLGAPPAQYFIVKNAVPHAAWAPPPTDKAERLAPGLFESYLGSYMYSWHVLAVTARPAPAAADSAPRRRGEDVDGAGDDDRDRDRDDDDDEDDRYGLQTAPRGGSAAAAAAAAPAAAGGGGDKFKVPRFGHLPAGWCVTCKDLYAAVWDAMGAAVVWDAASRVERRPSGALPSDPAQLPFRIVLNKDAGYYSSENTVLPVSDSVPAPVFTSVSDTFFIEWRPCRRSPLELAAAAAARRRDELDFERGDAGALFGGVGGGGGGAQLPLRPPLPEEIAAEVSAAAAAAGWVPTLRVPATAESKVTGWIEPVEHLHKAVTAAAAGGGAAGQRGGRERVVVDDMEFGTTAAEGTSAAGRSADGALGGAAGAAAPPSPPSDSDQDGGKGARGAGGAAAAAEEDDGDEDDDGDDGDGGGGLRPGAKGKQGGTKGGGQQGSRIPGAIPLAKCLEEFCLEEQLSERDTWFCSKCKEHVRAFKRMVPYRLPPVLVLHLKRFKQRDVWVDRNNAVVDFPIDGLDMSRFLPRAAKAAAGPAIYDLFAVDNHMGSTGGGHYTAYARSPVDDHWYSFDDSYTRRLDRAEVHKRLVTASAYVLFYRRRGADVYVPPPAGEVRQGEILSTREAQERGLLAPIVLPKHWHVLPLPAAAAAAAAAADHDAAVAHVPAAAASGAGAAAAGGHVRHHLPPLAVALAAYRKESDVAPAPLATALQFEKAVLSGADKKALEARDDFYGGSSSAYSYKPVGAGYSDVEDPYDSYGTSTKKPSGAVAAGGGGAAAAAAAIAIPGAADPLLGTDDDLVMNSNPVAEDV